MRQLSLDPDIKYTAQLVVNIEEWALNDDNSAPADELDNIHIKLIPHPLSGETQFIVFPSHCHEGLVNFHKWCRFKGDGRWHWVSGHDNCGPRFVYELIAGGDAVREWLIPILLRDECISPTEAATAQYLFTATFQQVYVLELEVKATTPEEAEEKAREELEDGQYEGFDCDAECTDVRPTA
jgi:hypothetical protein